ncbi:MAG: hypothetical protein ACOCP8_08955 [archaeon]
MMSKDVYDKAEYKGRSILQSLFNKKNSVSGYTLTFSDNKYECYDAIIENDQKIYLIEIKYRYVNSDYYNDNVIELNKFMNLRIKANDLRIKTGKEVRIYYLTFYKDNVMFINNISKIKDIQIDTMLMPADSFNDKGMKIKEVIHLNNKETLIKTYERETKEQYINKN